jgi:hypothetical protein
MLMMLVALSFGISVLFAAKVVISSVLSFLLYGISRMWGYCDGRRNHYLRESRRKQLGLKESFPL